MGHPQIRVQERPIAGLFCSADPYRFGFFAFDEPCSAATALIFCKAFGHPSLILLNAKSFFGVRKPECTKRIRVPPSTLVSVHLTTVCRREPYSAFASCPPVHAYTRRSFGVTSST